jgi:hypothetical protein
MTSVASNGQFNRRVGLFIIGYHALLVILLPVYFCLWPAPSGGLICTTAALFVLTELGITAGYQTSYIWDRTGLANTQTTHKQALSSLLTFNFQSFKKVQSLTV